MGKDNVLPITGHVGRVDGGGWSATRPGSFTPIERTGTHCTGDWVAPGPVLTGAENLAPTGIRFPGPSIP